MITCVKLAFRFPASHSLKAGLVVSEIEKNEKIGIPILLHHRFHKALSLRKYVASQRTSSHRKLRVHIEIYNFMLR